jgi:cytoskeletal protein CcmA (bactofilin family)
MDNNKSQSVISNEVEFTGTIRSSGSIQIDGKLEGELHCGGDAVIGKSANIKGNLAVNSVTIEGTIHGNVVAKDRIEMKSSARVTGDIKAKRLSVEDGVTFIGRSEVNPSGSPIAQEPVMEPAGETNSEERSEATPRAFARR